MSTRVLETKDMKMQYDFSSTINGKSYSTNGYVTSYPRTSTRIVPIQPLSTADLETTYDGWGQRLNESPKKIKLRGIKRKIADLTAGMLCMPKYEYTKRQKQNHYNNCYAQPPPNGQFVRFTDGSLWFWYRQIFQQWEERKAWEEREGCDCEMCQKEGPCADSRNTCSFVNISNYYYQQLSSHDCAFAENV